MAQEPSPKTFVPTCQDRIQQFFIFCNNLESHPFPKINDSTNKISITLKPDDNGGYLCDVNFDEIYLLSTLCLFRQVLFENELYYYKDLRRSFDNVFSLDKEFDNFYDDFCCRIREPFPAGRVFALKTDGTDATKGFNFLELLQARLYTGPIHSNRILSAVPKTAEYGVTDSHISVSKQLSFDLAMSGMVILNYIFAFRREALRLARLQRKIHLFRELEEFHNRCFIDETSINLSLME